MIYYSTKRTEQTLFGLKQDANITRLWELYDREFVVIPKKLSAHAQQQHEKYLRHLKAATSREMFRFQENEISRMKLDESIRARAECGDSVLSYYLDRSNMLPAMSSAFLLWFLLVWLPLTRLM